MEIEKIITIMASAITIIVPLFGAGYFIFSIFDKQRKRIEEVEKTVSSIKAEMDLIKQILPTLNQIIENYNKKRKK